MRNKKTYDWAATHTSFIKQVCQPLFDTFNITTFGYKKVLKNGKYIFFSTREEWLKFHYENIGGHGLFFKGAMDRSKEAGFERAIWPKEPKDDFLQSLFLHNMSNGINFYRTNGDDIDLWTFSTEKHYHQDPNSYVEILNYLEKFIIYFNGMASGIIKEYKDDDYASLIGQVGLEQNHDVQELNRQKSKLSEFNNLLENSSTIIQGNNGPIILTKRQKECLKKLCYGKTAKEIARDLDISARTVEDHLDIIKQKGGFCAKSELICQFYKALLIKDF
tara:strand:+ start:8990 stop:9817 length:828 start_codon:yes stop_codon:yes gene_type:complete